MRAALSLIERPFKEAAAAAAPLPPRRCSPPPRPPFEARLPSYWPLGMTRFLALNVLLYDKKKTRLSEARSGGAGEVVVEVEEEGDGEEEDGRGMEIALRDAAGLHADVLVRVHAGTSVAAVRAAVTPELARR